jgi:predicted outer membrane repeat protein
LNNVTLSGNSSRYEGGGVYSTGTLIVNNSAFTGSIAYGPLFFGWGGGLYAGSLTLTNSTLSNNTANGGAGGIQGTFGTITGCTIVDNRGGVGGVFADDYMTITNSTVAFNTATSGGGGVYSDGGLTLSNEP